MQGKLELDKFCFPAQLPPRPCRTAASLVFHAIPTIETIDSSVVILKEALTRSNSTNCNQDSVYRLTIN